MTSADYQKRLRGILGHHQSQSLNPDLSPKEIDDEAEEALTALCRDVCGEVVGNDKSYSIFNALRADQRVRMDAILGQPQEESNASS